MSRLVWTLRHPVRAARPAARRARRFIDDRGGRVLFGNTIGLRNNLEGRRRWRRHQLRPEGAAPSDEVAAGVRERGWAPLDHAYDPAWLESTRAAASRALERDDLCILIGKEGKLRTVTEGRVYRRVVRNALEAAPGLAGFLDEPVKRRVGAYYRANFRVHSVTLWRNFDVEPEILANHKPYSLDWHYDKEPIDTLILFLLLSDVGVDDGPLHFLTRQRSSALVRRGYHSRHDYRIPIEDLEQPEHLHRLTGGPGDGLLINTTLCLHRAGVPAAGHQRDLVQFRFESSETPLPDDWDERERGQGGYRPTEET